MCGAGVLDKDLISLDFWTGWPRRFYNVRTYDEEDVEDEDDEEQFENLDNIDDDVVPAADAAKEAFATAKTSAAAAAAATTTAAGPKKRDDDVRDDDDDYDDDDDDDDVHEDADDDDDDNDEDDENFIAPTQINLKPKRKIKVIFSHLFTVRTNGLPIIVFNA